MQKIISFESAVDFEKVEWLKGKYPEVDEAIIVKMLRAEKIIPTLIEEHVVQTGTLWNFMCASEAKSNVMTIKDPKKLQALLRTVDCGEIYSKINGELEFNVGYYSKRRSEERVELTPEELEAVLRSLEDVFKPDEGDEEIAYKKWNTENSDIYKHSGSVFKKAEQDGIEVNYKNKNIFKRTCRYMDSVADEGTLFRCGIRKEGTDLVVEMDLMYISSDEEHWNGLLDILDVVDRISFDGVPSSGIDAEIPEAVRMRLVFEEMWER